MADVQNRALFVTKFKSNQVVIEVDSCLEETHTLTNTVTDHPVEEGFNVTDHSRPDPDVVNLRCFISNTPLSTQQMQRAVRSGSVSFQTTSASGARLSTTGISGRGNDAFLSLDKLRKEGALIEVVSTLKTYGVTPTTGMLITSVTIQRTRQNYDGLEFAISLKQIRIVKNKATIDVRPKDKRAQKKEKKGEQPTEPAPLESKASKLTGAGEVPNGAP